MGETAKTGGLYIHIPFCIKKCAYCDFFSIEDLTRQEAFVDAAITEMRLKASCAPGPYDTLYFGGGTPSTLSIEHLETLIDRIHHNFKVSSNSEITLEVNPGTLDASLLHAYRLLGINRLNIGIQSLEPRFLTLLGRVHSRGQAEKTIDWVRRAGFDNMGLDLMFGLPGQSETEWETQLRHVVDHYAPEHLSCYALTFEPGTRLSQLRAQGRITPLSDKTIAHQFDTTLALLSQKGYQHYEISNFARKAHQTNMDYRSRHNLKYWSFAPYLGLGPSAHSYDGAQRSWNIASVTAYIEHLKKGRLPLAATETLTAEQKCLEFISLRLRTSEGILIQAFNDEFHLDFRQTFDAILSKRQFAPFIELTGNTFRLTRKGMRYLDSIIGYFAHVLPERSWSAP